MRELEVVAAAILRGGLVFAARRRDRGDAALKWEFPGGKIEAGESARGALIREIREELGLEIEAGELLGRSRHRGREAEISLGLYRASILEGEPLLREHLEGRWLGPLDLAALDWAPADLPLLPLVEGLLAAETGRP